MRRIVSVLLLALSAVALLAAAPTAFAAKKKNAAAKPAITRVAPMRISVGAKLTISGRNFKSKRSANTVIFRAPSGRAAFAKPRRARTTRLVVTVPGSVRRLLNGNATNPRPTRFKLRVLAGKFSKYTSRRLSPVVTSGGARSPGNPAASCNSDSDHDNDLLSNDRELELKTDPCLKDTDTDGIEDGFEYQSALDLNDDEHQDPNTNLPYPGKRPYPNPLFPDGNRDFDRDVLTQAEEQRLWNYTVANGEARTLEPLSYSDGEQASLNTREAGRRRPTMPAGAYPKHQAFLAWAAANGYRTVMLSDGPPWWSHPTTRNPYGLLDFNRSGTETAVPVAAQPWPETLYFDHNNDGFLQDDERDEDADGLTNYEETHGRLTFAFWRSCYSQERPFPIEYAGTDVIDPDTDGDGVRDGADDQDHDDVPNLLEISRMMASGLNDAVVTCKPRDPLPSPPATHHPNAYGRVNPYNPCLPATWARTCDLHPSFGDAGAPFDDSPNWYSLN
jgi:hypothetical protein